MKKVKAFIVGAAKDVDDKLFWKRIFVFLWALFPLLKLLRRADSNHPNMDNICYYLNQTCLHLIKSKNDLMDENLFPIQLSRLIVTLRTTQIMMKMKSIAVVMMIL
jgi:hypothetical protein